MNYIGIDPSITSTGMCINGKLYNYCYNSSAKTKKGELTKWFKLADNYITYRYHDKVCKSDYSNEQISKMELYEYITDIIIVDIKDNISKGQILIAIEGYAYSSAAGHLIDLVTFSTILRQKLLLISKNITIIAPKSLKKLTCRGIYGSDSYDNITGGNFKKIDIYNAVSYCDSEKLDDYTNFLNKQKKDLGKLIPKPIEDINDAICLYLTLTDFF